MHFASAHAQSFLGHLMSLNVTQCHLKIHLSHVLTFELFLTQCIYSHFWSLVCQLTRYLYVKFISYTESNAVLHFTKFQIYFILENRAREPDPAEGPKNCQNEKTSEAREENYV